MGSEQFSTAVRGSAGTPISVSASTGSIETNEYGDGEAVVDNTYPITVDPAFTVEDLHVFAIPSDKVVTLSLENGTTISGIKPQGIPWVVDTLEIDSVEITDPQATAGDTSLLAIGDAEAV